MMPEVKTYSPALGAANRYENAKRLNPEFARMINQDALIEAEYAMPVLEKIEQNPELRNFHHERAGSQWMGEFLRDTHKKILDMYGVSHYRDIRKAGGASEIILNFLDRTTVINCS